MGGGGVFSKSLLRGGVVLERNQSGEFLITGTEADTAGLPRWQLVPMYNTPAHVLTCTQPHITPNSVIISSVYTAKIRYATYYTCISNGK